MSKVVFTKNFRRAVEWMKSIPAGRMRAVHEMPANFRPLNEDSSSIVAMTMTSMENPVTSEDAQAYYAVQKGKHVDLSGYLR